MVTEEDDFHLVPHRRERAPPFPTLGDFVRPPRRPQGQHRNGNRYAVLGTDGSSEDEEGGLVGPFGGDEDSDEESAIPGFGSSDDDEEGGLVGFGGSDDDEEGGLIQQYFHKSIILVVEHEENVFTKVSTIFATPFQPFNS